MKFNIVFLLRGPAGTVPAPNNTNPVEAKNMKELLELLAPHVPTGGQLGIECVGIEIKQVHEPKEYVFKRGELKEVVENERDQADTRRSTTVVPAPQIHTPGQTKPPPNPPKWSPPMCGGHGDIGTGPGSP